MHRGLLRDHGEAKRAEDPDYWVKKFDQLYGGYIITTDVNFFVDDVRYPNEYQYLVSRGFTPVLVVGRSTPSQTDLHESERHWRNFESTYRSYWTPDPMQRAKNLLQRIESDDRIEDEAALPEPEVWIV